jgi:hypothetical protein
MRVFAVSMIVLAGLLAPAGVAGADRAPCERGEFCVWQTDSYRGLGYRMSLETVNPGECVGLPAGFDGRSFVNRMRRPVTVYQGRTCSTEAEFDTYPGSGTYVPEAPYVVRAVQIWES